MPVNAATFGLVLLGAPSSPWTVRWRDLHESLRSRLQLIESMTWQLGASITTPGSLLWRHGKMVPSAPGKHANLPLFTDSRGG